MKTVEGVYPYTQNYVELCQEIRNAQLMYHVFKEPIMNNIRYDGLVREQVKRLKENPALGEAKAEARSIRKQICSLGNPAKHDYPMLQLNRKNDLSGLVSWLKQLPQEATVSISTKVTGVDLDLIYIEGRLHKAITRGDGLVGRDVTIAAYCIDGIQDCISVNGRVVIRGTVTSKTLVINSNGHVHQPEKMELLSHISNVLLKTSEWNEGTDLTFIAHNASFPENLFSTWVEVDSVLRRSGFGHVKHYGTELPAGVYEIGYWEEVLDKIKERIKSSSYLYPFNGLVFKVDQFEHRYDLGYTSRFPEWAISYVPKEGFTNAQIPASQ